MNNFKLQTILIITLSFISEISFADPAKSSPAPWAQKKSILPENKSTPATANGSTLTPSEREVLEGDLLPEDLFKEESCAADGKPGSAQSLFSNPKDGDLKSGKTDKGNVGGRRDPKTLPRKDLSCSRVFEPNNRNFQKISPNRKSLRNELKTQNNGAPTKGTPNPRTVIPKAPATAKSTTAEAAAPDTSTPVAER